MKSFLEGGGRLAQLGEDAEGALRMEEGDAHVVGAGPRGVVDHADAGLLQLGDAVLEALDGEGDVVQALAALLDEGRDRAGGVARLQQFQAHVADAEEADADLLAGHVLAALEDGPEGAFVEGPLGVDGADGDADVVDCLDGGHCSLLLAGAPSRAPPPPRQSGCRRGARTGGRLSRPTLPNCAAPRSGPAAPDG